MDIEELKRLHAAATPGEWAIDTEKNEGDYGSGDPDDQRTGFDSYVLHAPSGSICDTLNSAIICVEEETDGEGGHYAWDEVGERNIKWIAAIHNAFPAILRNLEAAERLRDALKILHDENMDYIKLNNLGAENNQSLRMAREALAAYDKETAK